MLMLGTGSPALCTAKALIACCDAQGLQQLPESWPDTVGL